MVPHLIALLLATVLVVLGATDTLAQAKPDEPRLALIIGNAAYGGQPLKNPANDARAVAVGLRKLGFTVIERIDAGKKAMEDAILDFGEKLKAGGIGLFYYAGHGLQVRGRNYLLPIDATLPSESSVRFQAVDIDVVLEQLTEARNRANIVILDACRNNPFAAQMRGAPSGLAAIDAARGTLIAYSTAPGKVAVDGTGANSPYTTGLVRALDVPGLKAEEMFKRVRSHVADATKGQQTPWESSSLTGDLVINLNVTVAAPPPAPPANRDAIEAAFWSSIGNSTNAADYEEYLRQFPSGVFSGLAKRRIADINRKQQHAALPPKAEPPAPPPLPERPRLVLEPVDKEFIAIQGARVREAPDTAARQVAALSAGQPVLVTAKVRDQNWFQVEREGKPLGFVAAGLLEDAAAYRARQEEEKRRQQAAEQEKQKQAAATPPAKTSQAEPKEDQRAWAAIANSNDPEKFAAFLQRYPDSGHATQAKTRLTSLGWTPAQVQAFTGAPSAPTRPTTTPAAAPPAAAPATRPQQGSDPQVAAAPKPATPQPQQSPAKSPTIELDASNEVICGFVRLKGLPVRKASIKCETSKRVHSGGGDVEVVNLTTRLDPADSYLYFFAERDVSGGGWKPIGADQIKTSNASWASKYSPRNMTDIIGGSFRHTKFNIFDKRDYACARGNTVGTKMARGSGEARHHSWIIYCEKGAHTVSDENLGKVYSALSFE